jgi:hypothetical protein
MSPRTAFFAAFSQSDARVGRRQQVTALAQGRRQIDRNGKFASDARYYRALFFFFRIRLCNSEFQQFVHDIPLYPLIRSFLPV